MYFWRLILNKRVTFMPIACFAFSPVSISAFFQFSSGDIGMTVTCIPVACFIFLLFAVNALFQFLGYSIGMKWITGWTNGHNLLKNILFRLNFQDEGKLYANCLYYILSFYVTCILFQFLGCGIGTHISILKGVQNGWIYTWKAMIIC